MDTVATNQIVSGTGMVLVGSAAAVLWWRISGAQLRWFAVGIGLWVVGVAIKVVFSLLAAAPLLGFLKDQCPYWLFVTLSSLYVGIESSLCEIGLTLLLVLLWRAPGRDASRAIAVGTGAGAFEAILLGLAAGIAGITFALVDHPQLVEARDAVERIHLSTPLIWLIGPVERILAILCHMSSRALVLLGITKRRYWLVLWGFVLFTFIDSVAGATHVAGLMGEISLWWIELAVAPAAVASVFIIYWVWRRWGGPDTALPVPTQGPTEGFSESGPVNEETTED